MLDEDIRFGPGESPSGIQYYILCIYNTENYVVCVVKIVNHVVCFVQTIPDYLRLNICCCSIKKMQGRWLVYLPYLHIIPTLSACF